MHVINAAAAIQRIAAAQTDQGIIAVVQPGTTVQNVRTRVAGDHIVRGVPEAIDGAVACQRQVFKEVEQRVGQICAHSIGAASRGFDQFIGDTVAHEGVIAVAADHAVIAGAAVQRIVPRPAKDGVVAIEAGQQVGTGVAKHLIPDCVAGAGKIVCAGQDQVFEIGKQGIAEAGFDQIGADDSSLDHHIAGAVDAVAVIAKATCQAVIARPAIHRVIAVAAKDRVIAVKA